LSDSRTPAGRQPVTPDQAFAAAVNLHRAGRVSEAEQFYRKILRVEAGHFGATHYLGLACTQQGKHDEAITLLQKAVASNPASFEALGNLGLALAATQQLDAAVAQYRKAIALQPDYVEARNNLGSALIGLGRHADAIAELEQALAIKPDLAALHNNLGSALAALGRHADAVQAYREAVRLDPKFTAASNNLGLSLVALGRPDEALGIYRTALALTPGDADAHANLAMALAALDRHEEAISHFEAALAARPGNAEAHNNLGNSLAALNRHGEALAHYTKAIQLRPDLAEVHNNLGNALATLQRHPEAVAHYRKALALQPRYAEAHNNLGSALVMLERAAEAEAHHREAIAIRPEFTEAHRGLGDALAALDRYDEAQASFHRALALDPDFPEAHAGLGNLQRTLGRLDEARQTFEKAIALAPRRAEFHRALAEAKRFAASDPQLAAMEALAQEALAQEALAQGGATLSTNGRTHLQFALAKAYDDIGDSPRAFQHLIEGNALKRAAIAYDPSETLRLLVRTADIFTSELMRRQANQGDASPAPIFIVGMPRSGSSLIEQVLASHSGVFGAGEITDFNAAAASLAGPGGALPKPFPELAAEMTADQFRRVGSHYVNGLRSKAPAAMRITDKTLGNFLFAGLIHLALPNARIIHARRNPVDTCLSCFSKLFASQMFFTYDLAELGQYYRAYDALMAHWRKVLPAGVMLEVSYEDMVADFEPQAKRILGHCGLEWEEACLSFHTTQRPVKTASATQVREPLYRAAVGRSRSYRALLSPLLDALGPSAES
jgi:tetratricopeptide (TPR) repeat protein